MQNYPIMEHFYSLQGEGFHTGRAAYFIRIAGCDVGCVWCDVKESWDKNLHPTFSVLTLLDEVKKANSNFVVITGGEPAMYDLTDLTKALKENGIEIALETSGAHPIKGQFDWICLSPKKFKFPLEENYSKANELKMIIFNSHDLTWAEELRKKVSTNCHLYIQPEWDKQEKMLPLMTDYVKANKDWKISLQTHKFMNIP